jgi:hypothetical protein
MGKIPPEWLEMYSTPLFKVIRGWAQQVPTQGTMRRRASDIGCAALAYESGRRGVGSERIRRWKEDPYNDLHGRGLCERDVNILLAWVLREPLL